MLLFVLISMLFVFEEVSTQNLREVGTSYYKFSNYRIVLFGY